MTDASIQPGLRITLTNERFSALEGGDKLVIGAVGDIASISVRAGESQCEGAVTINSSDGSVDVELGELAMMQLRAWRSAFLDSPTLVVLPDGADWQVFGTVMVERQQPRQAQALPSEKDELALQRREAKCRPS